MSDTPRTDSIPRRGPFHHYVVDDVIALAKELEMELASERERTRQMVAGKVADDEQRARAMALISERQVKELRTAWEAGFNLAVSYGDNFVHFDGEQKERQWRKFFETLK